MRDHNPLAKNGSMLARFGVVSFDQHEYVRSRHVEIVSDQILRHWISIGGQTVARLLVANPVDRGVQNVRVVSIGATARIDILFARLEFPL
jgi:hypothetical protein